MDILVQFSPKLSEENIREEAVRLAISKSIEEKVTASTTATATATGDHASRKGKHRKSLAASPMVSSFASVATSGSQHQPPSESSEGRGHMQSKVPPPGYVCIEVVCMYVVMPPCVADLSSGRMHTDLSSLVTTSNACSSPFLALFLK